MAVRSGFQGDDPRLGAGGGTMRIVLGRGIWFWLAVAVAPDVWAGGGVQNVLLVANGQSQSSLAIANAYQQIRGIPEGNILYLPSSNTSPLYTTGAGADLRRVLNSGLFRTNILWPALNHIRSRGLTNQIDCIAYSSDIPTIIDARGETNSASGIVGTAFFSVTAMTSYGDLIEPMNTASNMSSANLCFRGFALTASPDTWTTNVTRAAKWGAAQRSYYMSMVLGWSDAMGSTVEDVTNMLARSLSADGSRPSGTVYMDANADVRGTTRSGQFSATATELAGLGIASQILAGNPSPYSLSNKSNVLGAVMGAAAPYLPAGSEYLPGSIAESLTSWSGIMDYSGIGQFRMTQHSGLGVGGTSGTVTEPFAISGKFPAARMHAHYARGATVGEAFHQAVQYPYHLLLMGDPLCRAHAIIPVVTVTGLVDGQMAAGVLNVTPEVSTTFSNGIEGVDLFLDGALHQSAAPGGQFGVDTSSIADGWHTALFVGYEKSGVRTQGAQLRHFRVNNHGEDVVVTPASQLIQPGGTASLTVTPSGGAAASVELRKGSRVLAVLGVSGGVANVPASLLGPGRSVVRAVAQMGSGEVCSEPVLVDVVPPADTVAPVAVHLSVLTGTNSTMLGGLIPKAANKAGDWLFLHLVPSEPVGLTNQRVMIGARADPWFPLKWNGLASTNRLPSLLTTTNPVIWRQQVSETLDPEGPLPVVVQLSDWAGNRSAVTNLIVTDYTVPFATQLWVAPQVVLPGQSVRLHFATTEPLASDPDVAVETGGLGSFESLAGGIFGYRYTVPPSATGGLAAVGFSNMLDVAGNAYSTMRLHADFEAMALGHNLTNDSRWAGPTGATYKPTAFVTNSPTAPGSARSAYFRDEPGNVSQIYGFKFPGRRRYGTAAFDAYLADRTASSNAEFRVFLSQGTTSRSEVQLVLAQFDAATWRVGVRGPWGTTYHTNGLAMQTWHRIEFFQDFGPNTYSVTVDGNTLADRATYAVGTTNLPWADTFNFTNSGNDEDAVIDNVTITDVLGYVRVSEDTDGDGIPDLWEAETFGDLAACDGGSDHDRDGISDRDEWRSGSDPRDRRSGLRAMGITGPGGGGDMTLRFRTSPGQTYLLQSSTDLVGPWADEGEYFSAGDEVTVAVPASIGRSKFWRLEWMP